MAEIKSLLEERLVRMHPVEAIEVLEEKTKKCLETTKALISELQDEVNRVKKVTRRS